LQAARTSISIHWPARSSQNGWPKAAGHLVWPIRWFLSQPEGCGNRDAAAQILSAIGIAPKLESRRDARFVSYVPGRWLLAADTASAAKRGLRGPGSKNTVWSVRRYFFGISAGPAGDAARRHSWKLPSDEFDGLSVRDSVFRAERRKPFAACFSFPTNLAAWDCKTGFAAHARSGGTFANGRPSRPKPGAPVPDSGQPRKVSSIFARGSFFLAEGQMRSPRAVRFI